MFNNFPNLVEGKDAEHFYLMSYNKIPRIGKNKDILSPWSTKFRNWK